MGQSQKKGRRKQREKRGSLGEGAKRRREGRRKQNGKRGRWGQSAKWRRRRRKGRTVV